MSSIEQLCGPDVENCHGRPFCIHMQHEAEDLASKIADMVEKNQEGGADGRGGTWKHGEYVRRTENIVQGLARLADTLIERVYG